MISQLLIATENKGKIREIVPLLSSVVSHIITLADLDERFHIEETGKSFEENAILKAETIFRGTGIVTLADDSGLEVDALDGKPGVFSARFAGNHANDADNNRKLLELMQGIPENRRHAWFKCVVALATKEGTETFEGTVEGSIAFLCTGTHGFGYDPLFIPHGYTQTFGELGPGIKSGISHRTRALGKAVSFLKHCDF